MLKKLVALSALSAALIVAPGGTPANADPDYTPGVLPTQTIIDVEVGAAGESSTLFVSASANSVVPPEGDIAVELYAGTGAAREGKARGKAAAPILSTTVHFEGDPVAIETPALPKGSYTVTAAFTPDDGGAFLDSDNTAQFRVRVGGDTGGVDESEGSGGLPNTGGPNLMWLLLGGGLVAAGASGVAYGRRREDALA